jgi:hypothetical protein
MGIGDCLVLQHSNIFSGSSSLFSIHYFCTNISGDPLSNFSINGALDLSIGSKLDIFPSLISHTNADMSVGLFAIPGK